MLTSDVEIFVAECLATMPEFKRAEREDFPENKRILKNSVDLNRKIRMRLDAIKHEAGIDPEEIYITRWRDGSLSVNMGMMLLNIQVTFQETFSMRRLMRSGGNPERRYLFEEEFVRRYNDCWKQFNTVKYEINLAWRARDLEQYDIEKAILQLEEDYNREFEMLASLSTTQKNPHTQGTIKRRLENIRVLILKLRKIINGRT